MNGVIKKIVGAVWVLQDEDAPRTNSEKIAELTRQLLSLITHAPNISRISTLKPSSDYALILALNKVLVEHLDIGFLLDMVGKIKKYSIIRLFRPSEEEILQYFTSVIDILTRPPYVTQLRAQLDNPRHLHGLSRAIVKHLWTVSLFAFLWTKDKNIGRDVARAGLYHDITLHEKSSYIADFQHPQSGAEIARQLYESDLVTGAVEQHLFPDILRLWRFPSSRVAILLLISDVVVATTERCISIWLKSKRLVERCRLRRAAKGI